MPRVEEHVFSFGMMAEGTISATPRDDLAGRTRRPYPDPLTVVIVSAKTA
jgi:hypothetical protein